MTIPPHPATRVWSSPSVIIIEVIAVLVLADSLWQASKSSYVFAGLIAFLFLADLFALRVVVRSRYTLRRLDAQAWTNFEKMLDEWAEEFKGDDGNG